MDHRAAGERRAHCDDHDFTLAAVVHCHVGGRHVRARYGANPRVLNAQRGGLGAGDARAEHRETGGEEHGGVSQSGDPVRAGVDVAPRNYARRVPTRPTIMRSPTPHASQPRRFRSSRTDCAVCRCAGDRQLRHFRETVGNRTDGDGVLARRVGPAAAVPVGAAGTPPPRRRDAARRDGRGTRLARADVFLGRSVLRRRSCLVARLAPAHFGRRLDTGSELRTHGGDARSLGSVG